MAKPITLSAFTGEFLDHDRELHYKESVLPETVRHLRLVLLVMGTLYLVLGLIDFRVLGLSHGFSLLLGSRSAVAVACIVLSAALARKPQLATRSIPLNIVIFLLLSSNLSLILLRPQTLDSQLAATITLTFILFLFIPQRIGWMVAWSLGLALSYVGMLYILGLVPPMRLPFIVLTLLVINIAAWVAAVRMAKMHRTQFSALFAQGEANRRLQEEIDERRRLEEELRGLAQTDYLTGLNNRRWFFELAQQELRHSKREGTQLSLCLLDLDHFKAVNDLKGHPAGDAVLAYVAKLCRRELRSCDIIGRLGGEEFIIALPNASAEDAWLVAERIRRRIENSRLPGELADLRLSITIGISQAAPDEDDLNGALLRADQALYKGKSKGRNRAIVSTSEGSFTEAITIAH